MFKLASLFFILFFTSISLCCIAQVDYRSSPSVSQKKNPLKLNQWQFQPIVSMSLPLGDYAKLDIKDSTSGYAKIGYALNLRFNYSFKKFGLSASYLRLQNSFDKTPVEKDIRATFSGSGLNNLTYTVKISPWIINGFMPGIFAKVPLDENETTYFEPCIQIGWVNTSIPETEIIFTNTTNGNSVKLSSTTKSPNTFASSFGVNIWITANPKIFFLLHADYFSAYPRYEETYTFSPGNTYHYEGYQSIKTLNLGIGITILL